MFGLGFSVGLVLAGVWVVVYIFLCPLSVGQQTCVLLFFHPFISSVHEVQDEIFSEEAKLSLSVQPLARLLGLG